MDAQLPTVIFLHGLLGTCYAHFGGQIRGWRERYHLVPIDLPGHGMAKQDAEPPYYTTAVEVLRRQLLRHGPSHVISASYLGGTVAIRCALAYPELFRSLVVTGFVPEVPASVISNWGKAFLTLAHQNPLLAQQYDTVHGARWHRTVEIVTTEIQEQYTSSIMVTKAMLAELQVPTLVVNGAIKSDERHAAVELPLHNHLIQAGVIPAAGHIASQDQPEIFSLMVEQFWGRLYSDHMFSDEM